MVLVRDRRNGQGHAGVRQVHNRRDPVLVEPASGDGGADVRLVLVVGGDDLHRQAAALGCEVRCGQLRRLHRPLPDLIRERAAHVRQHADLDHVAGYLPPGQWGEETSSKQKRVQARHGVPF